MFQKSAGVGEPLWLSGKVVKNEKINEIERTRVRSPPRATSLKKISWGRCYDHNFLRFFDNFLQKIGVFLKKQCFLAKIFLKS
jgi:hypothetical protein